MLLGASIMIILISAVACLHKKEDTPKKHIEIVLRDLGHQLLLTAKDSSSRVLPVKQIDDNTYQISFQNNFSFISDTLINLAQRTFQNNALANDYIVNLRHCKQHETVFAFEMNSQKGNLTPCRGRKLEVGCYIIEIELLKKEKFNFLWLTLLIIPLGFVVKNSFGKKQEPIIDNYEYIQLGRYRFYADNNVLKMENNDTLLSEKETKALKIFSENIDQVVEREKLMKEIWEDKGIVVISKNVDVLISKLRKKLSEDPSIKITNVPGRGYKFTIE